MTTVNRSKRQAVEDQEIRELYNEYQQMKLFLDILRRPSKEKLLQDFQELSVLTKSRHLRSI